MIVRSNKTPQPDEHKPSLADLLTEEQEAQLTLLLAEIIGHKWGTLEIVIVEGKVRFFVPKPHIEAKTTGGILLTK